MGLQFMPITVSEIAEQVGRGDDNRFIERLHYWTRERLLLPLGKRHPGTGKRRVYAESAVQHARFLNAMTEARVSIEDQQRAMKVIREREQQTPDLWPLKEEHDVWLVIETYQGKSTPYFVEGSYTIPPNIESVHGFNLTKLTRATNG
jgi:DNA-binding transcriptional MerR regulator